MCEKRHRSQKISKWRSDCRNSAQFYANGGAAPRNNNNGRFGGLYYLVDIHELRKWISKRRLRRDSGDQICKR